MCRILKSRDEDELIVLVRAPTYEEFSLTIPIKVGTTSYQGGYCLTMRQRSRLATSAEPTCLVSSCICKSAGGSAPLMAALIRESSSHTSRPCAVQEAEEGQGGDERGGQDAEHAARAQFQHHGFLRLLGGQAAARV